MGLIKMAAAGAVGAAGYALYKRISHSRSESKAAFAESEAGAEVRNAGPEAMRDPPQRWSQTDETVDESFPASDPPARY